jgi:hypothetical protein
VNFEDEHYVRLYTRDTKTWLKWGWEGQCVFMQLMRRMDKAGVLDDVEDACEDVALLTGMPVAVVEIGLPKILKSGAVEHVGNRLVVPNYIDAQTAARSDKLRARESRERRSATARLAEVTDRDGAVTKRDTEETNRDETTEAVTPRPELSLNAEQRSTTHGQRSTTQEAGARETSKDVPASEPVSHPPSSESYSNSKETPIPARFTLPDAAIQELCEHYKQPREVILRAIKEFRDFWTVGGGSGKLRSNWAARCRQDIKLKNESGKLAVIAAQLGSSAEAPSDPDREERLRLRKAANEKRDAEERAKLLEGFSPAGAAAVSVDQLLGSVGGQR